MILGVLEISSQYYMTSSN